MTEKIAPKDLEKVQQLKEEIEEIKIGNLTQDERDLILSKTGLTQDEMAILLIKYPEEFLSSEDLERIEEENKRTKEILEKICVRDRNPSTW